MSTIGSIHPFATPSFTGILNTSQGGTGLSCINPPNGILVSNGCNPVTILAPATNGQIPIGNTGGSPVLTTITAGSGIAVTNGPGTITISSTGTGGSTTYDGNTGSATPNGSNLLQVIGGAGGTISTSGSGNLITIAIAGSTNGSIPIGQGEGMPPVFSTITAGSGITVTNGPGTITISSTGTGGSTTFGGNTGSATPNLDVLNIIGTGAVSTVAGSPETNDVVISVTGGGTAWIDETSSGPMTMTPNTGYIADDTSRIIFTLPASGANSGDTLYVVGGINGTGGWQILENSGQRIYWGSATIMAGPGHGVASTNQFDSVRLVCINTSSQSWSIIEVQGNPSII